MDKEKIKQFLKPSKDKMFLFLIFTVIFVNIPFASYQDTSGPVYHLSFWEITHTWEHTANSSILFEMMSYGVPILIISYLLSSVIFFIYYNFKNIKLKIGLISLIVICIVLVGMWWTQTTNQIDKYNQENYRPWFLDKPIEVLVYKEINCNKDLEPWAYKRNEYNHTYEQIFNVTNSTLMNKKIKNYYKENYNIVIHDIYRNLIFKTQDSNCSIDTILYLRVSYEDIDKMLELGYSR